MYRKGEVGILDWLLEPVANYMIRNQTFLPNSIEVVPAGDRWAVPGRDEYGDRRVLGTARTEARAEEMAQRFRAQNAPQPPPRLFRDS